MNFRNSVGSILGAVFLAGVLLLYMCSFQVKFTEVAVVKTWGKPADEPITTPGLKFKWPYPVQEAELYDKICVALERSGLANDALELEVTESMLMNNPRRTAETLKKLKSAGITISIDDFGTGYSSLSYLKRFPIDSLKIDRSFVSDLTTNPDDAAIATAIILMGHSLKLHVVAEGVETESQLQFLQALQCNEIQGFLISRPVPAEQAELLLRAQMAAAA